MLSLTPSSRFFGIDPRSLGAEVRAAWQQIREWPVFGALSPAVPVRLLRAGGQVDLWLIDSSSARPTTADVSTARFTAIELPEEELLLRRINLPRLPAAEVAQAVALEVAAASPFAAEDTVWGHTPRQMESGKLEIQIALASRTRIMQSLSVKGQQEGTSEVWALTQRGLPVVFQGFGESRRLAHARVRQRAAFGLLLLALGLATAIAVTPVAQARLRAIEAQQAAKELTRKVEPMVRQRATLMRNVETLQSLGELLADRADPLLVMDLLTRVLPDDTSLLGLNIQGSKVSISGSTADAAALMQLLSARAELRDVKAPTPATRPLGTSKDSFNIEFTMASAPPRAKVSPVAAASGPAASNPGSQPVPAAAPFISPLGGPVPTAPAPPAPAQASPAAAAQPAQQPPSQSGASFGGATFGAPAQPARAP